MARPALTRMRRSVGVMGMNLGSPSTVPRVMAQPTGSSLSSRLGLAGHDRLDERLVVVVGHDREGAADRR